MNPDILSEYAQNNIPFFCLFSFDGSLEHMWSLSQLPEWLMIDFPSYSSTKKTKTLQSHKNIELQKKPFDRRQYKQGFSIVQENLKAGNSFLTNLTYPVSIDINSTPEELFHASGAKYKILFDPPGHHDTSIKNNSLKNSFVCFSPEPFVTIDNKGIISSYPMKGTMDADLPDAYETLLHDEKEKAEHLTIVDLIRNDLGIVSQKVWVEKYRYIETVHTKGKNLLQASSQVCGQLPIDYKTRLGEIITKLLPAGSISGAPKKKTLEIIKQAEGYERGFYTGIAGIFDGKTFDSCVMIRFVEFLPDQSTIFKTGGGITIYSNEDSEYQELMDKVNVPLS